MAFALVGGYVVVKSEDEDLKKTAMHSFWVLLIFTALTAAFSIFSNILGLSDNYSSTNGAYRFYSVMTKLISIAEIVVYAIFILLTLFKKENEE